MNTQSNSNAGSGCPATTCSASFVVRDLTGSARAKIFPTREAASQWYRHLFEVRPDSRCVIEEVPSEYLPTERLVRHLLDALKRIAECEDAPDIDATGEWQTGLHCGVEDRDCRDRYEGADYGHAVGVEKGLEWASNEAKHALESLHNAESMHAGNDSRK